MLRTQQTKNKSRKKKYLFNYVQQRFSINSQTNTLTQNRIQILVLHSTANKKKYLKKKKKPKIELFFHGIAEAFISNPNPRAPVYLQNPHTQCNSFSFCVSKRKSNNVPNFKLAFRPYESLVFTNQVIKTSTKIKFRTARASGINQPPIWH